ncbi:MAG: CBS domain-containing protein [Gallionellaceae bacterium]|jgi:diguanylate cyclase (GGDEF)-like protein/PAS domain S-box-containing protein
MKKVLLSEILTPSVKTTSPDAIIADVLAEMAALKISCVVAVDAERRPLGIFTERDAVRLLAERRGLGKLKMAEVMSTPPFSSSADIDFREAYRLLQERGFRHLVVVDGEGRLQGIVTEGDFLQRLDVGDLSEFKSAEKVMSRNIVTVDVEAPVADAIGLMSRNRYSCVVVVREHIPYGILTERDVVRLAPVIDDVGDIPVSSVVRTPLITAPPGMTLPDAIKLMARHKIRHLVVTENDKLLGLLTRHDLVKTLQGSYVHFLHETIQVQRNELFRLSQQRSLFMLHDAALAASANAIIIADRQAVIQWANPAFSELSGYTLEETVGSHMRDLVKSGEQSQEFYAELWGTLLDGRVWHGEIINKRKDGTFYPEEMTITPVRLDSDEITHFIAVKQDISERKQAEAQIYNLAFFDALTRLPNRRLLNDRLDQTMAASKRSGRYGALMFMDLDNFKPLNDVHGHEVGDLLLQEVARRINSCVREVDTVARFGGDEFVVVLRELDADMSASTAQAAIIAEKIRIILAEPYSLTIPPHPDESVKNIVEHHCTSSIGVVLFRNHDATSNNLIKWADLAMYQAKSAGRNLIRFYDSRA